MRKDRINSFSPTWEESIELYQVPDIYRDVTLESSDLLTNSFKEGGEAWLNSFPRRSLFISGIPGSGKTHFSYCLLRGLVERISDNRIFEKSCDIDQKISEDGGWLRMYCEVPYLFIDDLGVEKLTDKTLLQYYKIFDTRTTYKLCTIITCNFRMDEVSKNWGDRIASRIGTFQQVNFPPKDLRKIVGEKISLCI